MHKNRPRFQDEQKGKWPHILLFILPILSKPTPPRRVSRRVPQALKRFCCFLLRLMPYVYELGASAPGSGFSPNYDDHLHR